MKLEKIALAFLLILVNAYFGAIFFLPGTNYVFYLKPSFIPVFLVYAILKNGYVFPKRYFFFVFLFYIGQTLMLYSDHSETVLQLALVFHVLFYFALVSLAWPLLRDSNFKKLFTDITFFVILLNAFFLSLIVYIIIVSTINTITNFITVLNAILALMLMIIAVVYLSLDINKKSILYFFGAIFIILSDVLGAATFYYVYAFALNILNLILQLFGFYLIYLFTIEKVKLDYFKEI